MTAHLGYVSIPGRGANNRLLCEVAERLLREGVRVAGTVQWNRERAGRALCDMNLQVLPDGPVLRISEDRGDLARGCRLDASILEDAVVEVMGRLEGADLLIVNKFGKTEAEGGGFVAAIVAAMDAGMPVLVGVNGLNLPAFLEFAADMATPLTGQADLVADWLDTLITEAPLPSAA